ncbi:MAG: assimilatory sulfite reductase (NADPH) flavoprotein subunit [Candidatus Thiodiazotropha sp. (ex Epidulcina cf. delphinae)]|nr:assimilatory sulfite reductase (NADPH) flavoprotein subunit [Candidatus Thiodiazotropha sp. (ex Epidulcina cf. delphinae)]
MQNSAETLAVNSLSGFQLSRLDQAIEGLTAEQLTWASGYLAGLGVEAGISSQAKDSPLLTILYASQGGNARAVAETLAANIKCQGFSARLVSAENYRSRDLSKEKLLILVISTQGEGEPPESARELFKYMDGKKPPKLKGLKYAIFGLGDSSYEHFCQAGKDLDRLLKRQGAHALVERVDADVDFQDCTEAWYGRILAMAEQELTIPQARVIPLQRRAEAAPRYDRSNPYQAEVLENRRITTAAALSSVHHLSLEVDAGSFRYQPGDSLGVLFHNDPALVDEVLSLTGLAGDDSVSLRDETLTLSQALGSKLELTQLHPKAVSRWASIADNAELSAISGNSGRLRMFAYEHQFVDMLHAFPARIDAAALADLLQPIQPRCYSIASSQAVFEDEVHLTVATLQYRAHERDHLGGASGYLTRRVSEGESLAIYVADNPSFRLPKNADTPIIMIGAGTGIAPYRAFLQEREARGAKGRNWLVYGNRNFHRDFLYQTDWLKYRKAGLLGRFSLAFSRDSEERLYVQHRLLEEGAEVYRWLQDGAYFYVCGGVSMERSVYHSLKAIVQTHGGLGSDAACEFIEALRSQGRYLRDVY